MVDWLVVGTMFFLFLLGLISAFYPMKVIWFGMNWPRWSTFNLIRQEDYDPKLREAKRLFDKNPKEFAEEYLSWLYLIRIIGLFALAMFALMFIAIVLPELSGGSSSLAR